MSETHKALVELFLNSYQFSSDPKINAADDEIKYLREKLTTLIADYEAYKRQSEISRELLIENGKILGRLDLIAESLKKYLNLDKNAKWE